MANELVQILLNTLEPDTLVVKNSQLQLEKLESNAEFPLVLGQIICESQNHPKQLDLISVTTLARSLKHYYKYIWQTNMEFSFLGVMMSRSRLRFARC